MGSAAKCQPVLQLPAQARKRMAAVEELCAWPAEPVSNALPGRNLASDLDQMQEWQLALRICASRGFAKSELLQRFLLHVCELQLLHKSHEITEQKIGICIFHRADGYDPGEDNIVRSYARMLRKRLDVFFAEDGANEPIRITIPRGGYIPCFETSAERQPVERTSNMEVTPRKSEVENRNMQPMAKRILGRNGLYLAGAFLLGMAAAALCWLPWMNLNQHGGGTVHLLWNQLFAPGRMTLVVPADSGLGILQNLSHRLISVDDYASGNYVAVIGDSQLIDKANLMSLSQQRYTSMADLKIVSRLMTLPEWPAERAQIRFARSLNADDLKNTNVILIGSKYSNPWVALAEERMNFQFDYASAVDGSLIRNRRPFAGEQTVYRNGASRQGDPTYGVLAYLKGPTGNHLLVIEGLNMAATEAVADVLLDEKSMAPILREVRRRDDSMRSFELLVETRSVGASAPSARILAKHISDDEEQ